MLTPKDDLQRAFDNAKPGDVLTLAPGEFRQKIVIRTPGVTVIGSGPDSTKIVWDDYAKKLDEQGREYITFRTQTVAVTGDNVTMRGLTIENDALHPEIKGQEVALSVYADGFYMENSTLRSTQDTLFLGPLPSDLIERYDGFLDDELRRDKRCRQTFRHCYIEGTVDFIFGCGEADFIRCYIKSIGRGYIAAPAHALTQERGFVFDRCCLAGDVSVPEGSVFLARPWRDYGMCEFVDCVVEGRHIDPRGFDKWNDTSRDKTARFYETPLPEGRVSWARSRA